MPESLVLQGFLRLSPQNDPLQNNNDYVREQFLIYLLTYHESTLKEITLPSFSQLSLLFKETESLHFQKSF